MVMPAIRLVEVAVCFAPLAEWFAVRGTIRVTTVQGESITDIVSSPLSRRQLEAESDGPDLADFLVAHPGSWWRLPLSRSITEGHGV